MLLAMFKQLYITIVPVDLPKQINKTAIITNTPGWVAPMIALPWLLLLIGILSVLVYIIIIKGM